MCKPTAADCMRRIDFWERGPVRQILDVEFEMAFLRVIGDRELELSAEDERRLHDAVVPEVFLLLTRKVRWTPEEEHARSFSLDHQRVIQSEIVRLLDRELGRLRPVSADRSRPGFLIGLVRWLLAS